MEHEKEKLNRFINAVNSVTDKQVKDILDEAQREKDSIMSAASAAAEDAKKRHLDDNLKMASAKYIRLVSKAELEKKKEVLICREELTRGLFDKVIAKIKEFTSTEDYIKLMAEEISTEDNVENAQICVSPEDMRLADKLKKAVGKELNIVSDDSIKYGGFYILRSDKGTVTDRTFDCALKEQQSLFSSRNLFSGREGNDE